MSYSISEFILPTDIEIIDDDSSFYFLIYNKYNDASRKLDNNIFVELINTLYIQQQIENINFEFLTYISNDLKNNEQFNCLFLKDNAIEQFLDNYEYISANIEYTKESHPKLYNHLFNIFHNQEKPLFPLNLMKIKQNGDSSYNLLTDILLDETNEKFIFPQYGYNINKVTNPIYFNSKLNSSYDSNNNVEIKQYNSLINIRIDTKTIAASYSNNMYFVEINDKLVIGTCGVNQSNDWGNSQLSCAFNFPFSNFSIDNKYFKIYPINVFQANGLNYTKIGFMSPFSSMPLIYNGFFEPNVYTYYYLGNYSEDIEEDIEELLID